MDKEEEERRGGKGMQRRGAKQKWKITWKKKQNKNMKNGIIEDRLVTEAEAQISTTRKEKRNERRGTKWQTANCFFFFLKDGVWNIGRQKMRVHGRWQSGARRGTRYI